MTPPADSGGLWTETVVQSFEGSDGQYPLSGVISDEKGNLYGTVSGGGIGNGGTVFRLSPPADERGSWEETILLYFSGAAQTPIGGLVFGSNGALYGSSTNIDGGTIYELTPPDTGDSWTESIIYSFPGGSDGNIPVAAPVFGPQGILYGTTFDAGKVVGCGQGCGVVYSLTPPSAQGGAWTENVLHSFTGGGDRGSPFAGVILDGGGRVYGTTEVGGDITCNPPDGCGVAFRLSPPTVQGGAWTDYVLHAFTGGTDGAIPFTPLLLLENALYGTTTDGGPGGEGTVFQIAPDAQNLSSLRASQ